jgi:N-acetylmuramoyl-L-alanine amidase
MRFWMRLTVAFFSAFCAGSALANAVSGMRVIGDTERTRFVVDLEKTPQYGLLRLTNPNRLVIDLPDAEFPEPAEPGEGRGLIDDYRYGLIAAGKGRIVLDLSLPVEIVNTFVLDPLSTEPARLVIDMVPGSAEAFEAAARADRPAHEATGAPEPSGPAIEAGKEVVVIDPGHGGIDSGASGDDGLLEKDVTLKFGLALAKELEAGGELEVLLTRDGDDFISLPDRVALAQQHKAALFVSIHADSVRQDYVRGATVYTLSEDASDELAAALAERENRSDILAGLALEEQPDDVADILFDLTRRESRNLSIRFAQHLVDDVGEAISLNSNPRRQASFRVLKAPEIPSILLELGYLSNSEDEELFRAEGWPDKEAESVARSIEKFFEGRATAGQ